MAALEQENVRAKYLYQSEQNRGYFFSIAVYHQLANLPPHQHPRLCTQCGWDEHTVQYDHNGDDTVWSADNAEVCTRCEQRIAWEAQRAEAQAARHAA